MALVIEDGTGKSDAESYLSVTDVGTYHTNRGNAAWTGTDAVKEAALRKATAYLDNVYRHRWPGVRRLSTQALDWPRGDAYYLDDYSSIAIDVIPQAVKDATAELALRALSADLLPDLDRGNAVKSVTVGPISKVFMDGAPGSKVRPQITLILSRLLAPPGRFAQGPVTSFLYPRVE